MVFPFAQKVENLEQPGCIVPYRTIENSRWRVLTEGSAMLGLCLESVLKQETINRPGHHKQHHIRSKQHTYLHVFLKTFWGENRQWTGDGSYFISLVLNVIKMFFSVCFHNTETLYMWVTYAKISFFMHSMWEVGSVETGCSDYTSVDVRWQLWNSNPSDKTVLTAFYQQKRIGALSTTVHL